MRGIVLVTGGVRSGKSDYALELASRLSNGRKSMFLATCPPIDEELKTRIARHKRDRDKALWETVEEETDLCQVFDQQRDTPVILLDCLTLWVGNLLHYSDGELNEDAVSDAVGRVLKILRKQQGKLVAVTNEIGLGVVPDNAMARRYRDLLGRCNQVFAAAADEVILMVSGIPVKIKG